MTRKPARALRATVILILLTTPTFAAEKAVPLTTFARLPVKEITVFKDGHAFVAHEGDLPTDEHGKVLMDYLPTPVVGTFWPTKEGSSLFANCAFFCGYLGWAKNLRLDSFAVAEYVGFHGVCSSLMGGLGRESPQLCGSASGTTGCNPR